MSPADLSDEVKNTLTVLRNRGYSCPSAPPARTPSSFWARSSEQVNNIFLTQPNENGVLPQDSTYLTLEDIDLTQYKKQAHVGGIYAR